MATDWRMAMTDVDAGHDLAVEGARLSPRRDRSPSFPFIGLAAAIDRTRQLYAQARRHEVRLGDAAVAWQMGAKSSATLQTAAALLAFGLAEDSGSGDNRRIKVSELGWRILEDQRPGARDRGIAEAASKPKLLAEYAALWADGRPADNICISELKFERNFTDEAAARFLRVFDGTIQFAGVPQDDRIADSVTDSGSGEAEEAVKPPPPSPNVKVGDHVQWTSDGVDQFKPPRKVVGLFPDGEHAQVFGSNKGVPMSELTVVDPPAPTLTAVAPAVVAQPAIDSSSAGVQGKNEYSVLQSGNRLQITADVDLEGLETLKEMLNGYETILKLLGGKKPN